MLTEIHRQALENPIIELATRARKGEAIPYGEYGDTVQVLDRMDADMAGRHEQILCWMNKSRRRINFRCREILGIQQPFPVEGDRVVCLKNNHKKGLLNGTIWKVISAPSEMNNKLIMWIESEDGKQEYIMCHRAPFLGEDVDYEVMSDAEFFDYGYCLTVHKSQGSEWPSVLLVDESKGIRSQTQRRQWLYTGITRASERLTIVR
jgi:exodeoxyribonuclease-5